MAAVIWTDEFGASRCSTCHLPTELEPGRHSSEMYVGAQRESVCGCAR